MNFRLNNDGSSSFFKFVFYFKFMSSSDRGSRAQKRPTTASTSNTSTNAIASLPPKDTKEKKMKIKPYESLFVIKANQRAQERAKAAKQKLMIDRGEYKSHNFASSWDSTPAPNGLFDSKLHKAEIFKVQPRTTSPSRAKSAKPAFVTGLSPRQSFDRSVTPDKDRKNNNDMKKITMRTKDVRRICCNMSITDL